MLILSLIGFLVGMVLGMLLNVFVVVPVACIALAIAVLDGITRWDGLWPPTFLMIVIASPVQLGYFLGAVAKSVMGSVRGTNHGAVSLPRGRSARGKISWAGTMPAGES
jgi:hypothetical protein